MGSTKGILIIFCFLVLTGCGKPQINPSRSHCQILGGSTQICGKPRRIVALDPHSLDILLSLGIEPIGYAEVESALIKPFSIGNVMEIKYLGQKMKNPPYFVGTRNQPSLEAILNLKPDLIVSEGADNYNHLARIAPTILLDRSSLRWQENIQLLGQALALEAKSQEIITNHEQRIMAAKLKLLRLTQAHKLLFLESDSQSFYVFPSDTYASNLLKELGFELITLGTNKLEIPLEVLPDINADLMIVSTTKRNTIQKEKERWQKNPLLNRLNTFQNHKVWFVDYQLWGRIRGPIAASLIIDQVLEFNQLEQPQKNER